MMDAEADMNMNMEADKSDEADYEWLNETYDMLILTLYLLMPLTTWR